MHAATFVLQDWMKRGWKLQSILISGLRAPDMPSHWVKRVCRWMRAVSQHNADPAKESYMQTQPFGQGDFAQDDMAIDGCMQELEYMTCHYTHHFADALRVIGLLHPDLRVSDFANRLHTAIAEEIFHFHPESHEEFMVRHRDKAQGAASDPGHQHQNSPQP